MSLSLIAILDSRDCTQQVMDAATAAPEIELAPISHGPMTAVTAWNVPESFGPLDHARLIDLLHRKTTVLPVRFGMTVPDEAAVRGFLDSRKDKLLEALGRVRGACELGVRIDFAPHTSPREAATANKRPRSAPSPTEYLSARRACYQHLDHDALRAQTTVDLCLHAFEGLYRNWQRLAPEPPDTLRLSFLVDRRMESAFTNQAERLSRGESGDRYTLLGPWPPYSFV